MGLQTYDTTFTMLGRVRAVDLAKSSFDLEARTGDRIEMFVGATTYYQVVTNLDNVDRDRVDEPTVPQGTTEAAAQLAKYVQQGRMLMVTGLMQQAGARTRFEARAVWLLHSEPTRYAFEEKHWWINQTSQLNDRVLDHLFDARRRYTVDDFSKLYRTQLNIVGQPTGDDVQESAVLSRLIYDLSSAYLLTGSERYFLAARAAVDYLREAFRSLSHDGEQCFWAYGRRRLPEGEKGEVLLVYSLGPDDVGTIPLYEQIYVLAGLTQYYRITLDWEVLEDIRRTIRTFESFYHDPPSARDKGFAGTGGYYSHIDPVTMRPDTPALGANRRQKNWNSTGDHIPAYLVNLILTLDPLPQGRPRDMFQSLLDTCWQILDETTSLIVERFPDPESDYVNERFHDDWKPMHDYRWQQNRAVVGHNLKIAWNLTRVHNYYKMRAKMLEDGGKRPEARTYRDRADTALKVARRLADRMAEVGLDKLRGGVYDCVERTPKNGMPIQFAWEPTKDFWQQEQGILAYLILHGATDDDRYLQLARECSAFWNIFFLDRERQGYFFRTAENGQPIIEGEYGRKGGHALGYHASELSYLAHVYTRSYVAEDEGTFCLHFKLRPHPDQMSINVLPDFVPPGTLEITRIRVNGVDVTGDRKPSDPDNFQISLRELGDDVISLSVEFHTIRDATATDGPSAPPGPPEPRPLAGKKIAVVVESQFIPGEIAIYRERFAKYGAEVDFVSRLWGRPSQTFYSTVEPGVQDTLEYIEVTLDFEHVNVNDYHAVIVVANYPSVRLRWSEREDVTAANAADVARNVPAARFLRQAMQNARIIKGLPCHALWLLTPSPDLLKGRNVLCNKVVLADVLNAGGIYTPCAPQTPEDKQVVVDRDVVTSSTWHATAELVDRIRDGILSLPPG